MQWKGLAAPGWNEVLELCNKIYIILLYTRCRIYFFREEDMSFYCLLPPFRCVCMVNQTAQTALTAFYRNLTFGLSHLHSLWPIKNRKIESNAICYTLLILSRMGSKPSLSKNLNELLKQFGDLSRTMRK